MLKLWNFVQHPSYPVNNYLSTVALHTSCVSSNSAFDWNVLSVVSLCDLIDLKLKFVWNWIQLSFNWLFRSEFLESDQIIATKLIKFCLLELLVGFISKNLNYIKTRWTLIKNVKFNQKSSRFGPFWIKFQLFSI